MPDEPQNPQISMHKVEGETLAARLDRQPLALRETLDLAVQLADALAKAPTRLAADADTGAQGRSLVTEPGVIMGTAPYMSPEQANGQPADARSDVFSFGCVLYEMLTGHRAFQEATAMATMAAVVGKKPEPIAILAPGVPHAVQRIVTRALRKDPQDRYPSARELLVDVRSASEAVLQRAQPARRGALVAAVAIACVVVIIAAFLLLRTMGPRNETPASAPVKTTQITYSSGLDVYPTISPDGHSVAYSSDRNGRFEIYVRPLVAGGRDVQLTSDGKQNLQPAWSPHGTDIAYYSIERGGTWIVPVLGGLARQITMFGARPAWSRDATTIAFQSFPPNGVLEVGRLLARVAVD